MFKPFIRSLVNAATRAALPLFVLLFSASALLSAQAAQALQVFPLAGTVADDHPAAANPAPALPPVETASLYPMGNGSRVVLENRHYEGKLFVEAYGVTISGVPGSTIDGDIYVLANGFTLKNVMVDGKVTILGNGADLTGCELKGGVDSRGSGNKW
ncbi:MAG TPA: hypothetical protein VMW87_03955 [Spirochaetia bacterium]|nr:hypothetical protein [Spirochaetia bacterium]